MARGPSVHAVVLSAVLSACSPGAPAPMFGATDHDEDGYACAADCDDHDPAVHPDWPGWPRDANCDGTPGADEDSDGFDEGAGDCDDLDATVHPGANDNQGLVTVEIDAARAMWSRLQVDELGRPLVRYAPAESQPEYDQWGDVVGHFWSDGLERHVVLRAGAFAELDFPFARDAATAVGPGGATHVVFAERDQPHGVTNVMHAVHRGDAWGAPEIIATTEPDPIWGNSSLTIIGVDVDVCGDAHVLLQGETIAEEPVNPSLFWARALTNAGGDWRSSDLDSHWGGAPWSQYLGPRVARDGAGHVFEREGHGMTERSIRWWTTAPDGTWKFERVVGGRTTGEMHGDIALSASGDPRVVYHDGSGLHVLVNDGAWTDEVVAEGLSEPERGASPSAQIALVVDRQDRTHLLHQARAVDQEFTGPLREWVRAGSAWSERAPTSIDGALSAVVGQNGVLHLTFNATGGGLVYATRLEGLDGIDQNCDGVDGVDADGDGHSSVETGGDDPDDG